MVKESKKNVSMTLTLKTPLSFKTSKITHQVTQCYILEDEFSTDSVTELNTSCFLFTIFIIILASFLTVPYPE